MEQTRLRKSINKQRLVAESYEHDLQIAKTAFAYGESSIISRTRNLANIFGGILRSDEELVDTIQKLMQQAIQDEKTAEELRSKIDQLNATREQGDDRLDDVKSLLKQQKTIIGKKMAEVDEKQQRIYSIQDKLNTFDRKKKEFLEKIGPIEKDLGATIDEVDFFAKLGRRVNRMDAKTEATFKEIAELLSIDVPVAGNFDAKRFMDAVAFKYERLSEQAQTRRDMENNVTQRLETIKEQIRLRRKKAEDISKAVDRTKKENKAKKLVDKEVARVHQAEKQRILEHMKKSELTHLNKGKPATTKSADEIVHEMRVTLVEKVKALTFARHENERKRLNSAQELEGGIKVVEEATDAIARANRRLISKLRNLVI